MQPGSTYHFFAWIVAVSLGIGALAGGIKGTIFICRGCLQSFRTMRATLKGAFDGIDWVASQMRNNGGSSIKDNLDRIEERQLKQDKVLEGQDRSLAEIKTRVTEVEKRMPPRTGETPMVQT